VKVGRGFIIFWGNRTNFVQRPPQPGEKKGKVRGGKDPERPAVRGVHHTDITIGGWNGSKIRKVDIIKDRWGGIEVLEITEEK